MEKGKWLSILKGQGVANQWHSDGVLWQRQADQAHHRCVTLGIVSHSLSIHSWTRWPMNCCVCQQVSHSCWATVLPDQAGSSCDHVGSWEAAYISLWWTFQAMHCLQTSWADPQQCQVKTTCMHWEMEPPSAGVPFLCCPHKRSKQPIWLFVSTS